MRCLEMNKKNHLIALACLGAYQGTPLVDIKEVSPTIQVEMRYATNNNFTGDPLTGYIANRCFLLPKAAAALKEVQQDLKEQGLGLRVYDCYRPVSASQDMVRWATETGNKHLLGEYISSRSEHNKGYVLDLTLINLNTGQEVEIGKYDEFSAAAWTQNGTPEQKPNRQILKRAMEKHGFGNYSKEWWHFWFQEYHNAKDRYQSYTVPIQR